MTVHSSQADLTPNYVHFCNAYSNTGVLVPCQIYAQLHPSKWILKISLVMWNKLHVETNVHYLLLVYGYSISLATRDFESEKTSFSVGGCWHNIPVSIVVSVSILLRNPS